MMVFMQDQDRHHFSYELKRWQNRIFILFLICQTSIDCILLDLRINNSPRITLPWLISNLDLQDQKCRLLNRLVSYVLYMVFHHLILFHYQFWWCFQVAKGSCMLLLTFLCVIIQNQTHDFRNKRRRCLMH